MTSKAQAAKLGGRTKRNYGTRNSSTDIQVAKISSSTAIHVTRSQVVCTLLVALLTLIGVGLANLDKFPRNALPQTINRLQIEGNVAAAREFIERDGQEARNAQKILMLKHDVRFVEKADRTFDLFVASNHDRQDRFEKETERLNVGLQSGNSAMVEASRKRLTGILLEEASNLQDSIIQVDYAINKPVRDSDTVPKRLQKNEWDPEIDLFMKRKPAIELANILPIKAQNGRTSALAKDGIVTPDLRLSKYRSLANSRLLFDRNGGGDVNSQNLATANQLEGGNHLDFDKSGEKLYFLTDGAENSVCPQEKSCFRLGVRFRF